MNRYLEPTTPASMRALRIKEWGDLSRIRLESMPRPDPGPGEVLIDMAYSGVNFMDVYTVRGAYKNSQVYPLQLPLTIGVEGAGNVAALGADVDTFRVGDPVSFCLHWGAHAEWAAVPAFKVAHVPENVGLDVAAAATFQGVTAHYLAFDLARLQAGDWALVWSGAGGIARLLIQLLRRSGMRVVATASSNEKADAARRSGAEVVFSSTDPCIVAQVREATSGGAHVVYDSSGASTLLTSIKCLRRRGTLALVGTNSGPVPTIDVSALADAGSIYFVRPRLADFIINDEFDSRVTAVFAMIQRGELDASPASVFPLEQAETPLLQLVSRSSIGKSVLELRSGRGDRIR